MQNSRRTTTLGIAAIVTTILGATFGVSVFLHQNAFATPSGTPSAQGQCYQSQNSAAHASGTSGESMHDARDAVCPPPAGKMTGHTK